MSGAGDQAGVIAAAWSEWAAHIYSRPACGPCWRLARIVASRPAEPSYLLFQACCDDGRPLAEAWILACSALRDRLRTAGRP